jgi:hypothetical protein
MLRLAVLWPLFVVGYLGAMLAWGYYATRRDAPAGSAVAFSVQYAPDGIVDGLSSLAVFVGPSLALLLLWRISRRLHPPAT